MNNIEEAFKNHVATLKDLGEVQLLYWSEPGKCERAIYYMIYRGSLIVTGDFYNAIYSWSGKTSFENIANYGLHYFFSKFSMLCENKPYEWSGEDALESFKEYLETYFDNIDEEQKNELLEKADDCCNDKSGWHTFINDNYEFLKDDDCMLYSAGEKMPWMVEYHLEGLRMAMKQLENKGK